MRTDLCPDVAAYRAALFVPADAPRMVAKARGLDVDAIILDLEDAVAPERKGAARRACLDAAHSWPADGPDLWVRINPPGSSAGVQDLRDLAVAGIRNIVIPKIDAVAAGTFGNVLGDLSIGADFFRVIGLVESARGLLDAGHLGERLEGLCAFQLGAEDLSADMGLERTPAGEEIRHARNVLALAAHAQGLAVLDTPAVDYRDLEAVRADAATARRTGFTGKTCIHPAQIGVVTDEFTPPAQEIERARTVLDAFADALSRGQGATSVDGRMIDAPIAARARAVLARSPQRTSHDTEKKDNE